MATFEGNIIQRSAKAVCFWCHYWWAPLWLPLSQVKVEDDGDSHVIHLRDWLAEKRGVKEFTEYTAEELEEPE